MIPLCFIDLDIYLISSSIISIFQIITRISLFIEVVIKSDIITFHQEIIVIVLL